MRLAAVIAATSVVALGMTVEGGPASTTPANAAESQSSASASPSPTADAGTSSSDSLNVTVGKIVDVTTDAAGNSSAQGMYASTNYAGAGSSTVKVPMGTSRPVALNSFTRLQTENDTVVYNIKNPTNGVDTLIASGGQFQAPLPVTFTTELLVNGKSVDPNTATSITGDVELNYKFTNHTAHEQQITFKDVNGNIATKSAVIAIPFSISYDATFGNGWADLVAPWANTGFSAGQIITGSSSLAPSPLNGQNPNGTLTIKGKAQNAALPATNISVRPHSTSGSETTTLGKVTATGTKLNEVLTGKALPLLLEVEQGLGKASGSIATLLDSKVNPVLDLLERIKLDPNKANEALAKGGVLLSDLGNSVFALNSLTEGAAAKLATTGAKATSPANQVKLSGLVVKIGEIETRLGEALPLLRALAPILKVAAAVMATELPSLICGGHEPCTLGSVLETFVDRVPNACTTDQATVDNWNNGGSTALAGAIGGTSGTTKTNLTQLQTLLTAQAAVPHTPADIANCTAAANGIVKAVDGVFENLAVMGNAIRDLLPLLESIQKGLPLAQKALTNLVDAMPAINQALDHPCGAVSVSGNLANCGLLQSMDLITTANTQASVVLDRDVLALIKILQGPLDNVFAIINGLAAAAPSLRTQLNELPNLILQLAYGNVGSFVPMVNGLSELATTLTDVSSEQVEINKATDVEFNSGVGFPYGSASGESTITSAQYRFKIAAAKTGIASTGTTIGFALLLLLIGLGAAIWMQLRNRSHN